MANNLRRGVAKHFIFQPKYTKHFLTTDSDMNQKTSRVSALKEKQSPNQTRTPTQNWEVKGCSGAGIESPG